MIFGYSVSEALEMNVEELVPERLRERHRAGLARYRKTGHGPYLDSRDLLELPAVRKTGEEIQIEMSLSPIEPTRDVGDDERRYALAIVRDLTERKRTEEALRESEARFHALVRNALDIVMVTDPDGIIRYISPSVERVLGYRSEDMVGTSTAVYVHPDDLESALEELAEATSKPGVHPVAVETRVRHKDGSWRHLEGIANNLLEDPAVRGMVFNHREVTERKRAEEEIRRLNETLERRVAERTARLEGALADLRASEERYRLLVESAEDYAIFMVDHDGRVSDWNAGAERIFGYREEEIVGEPVSILFTPEDIRSGAPEEELRQAMTEGRADDERWHIRKDGTRFWASGVVTPVRDEAGNLRGFAKVARDVTERKWAEEDRARLAAIVESSDDIIIGKTLEGIIISWNKGAERIYGYSAEEAVGQPISMVVPPERPNEIPTILESIRRGEKVDHFETVRMAKGGRRLDISLTVSPIRDSAGDIAGASTIARDITERKRAEEAMRQAREDERRRIARDLHDGVLQDLAYTTAALGLMGLDAEGTVLEQELQKAIDAIRRAAEGLRAAVNDLRLKEEQDRPFPELVESLVQRNRGMARGYEISLEVEEEFPAISFGDTGTEIVRILQEVLTNARRHSRARNVHVTLSKDGEELVAEVSDDGQGFKPGTTTPGGVGLKSMRERALTLGGKLDIESKVGEGTRVKLRVPMPRTG